MASEIETRVNPADMAKLRRALQSIASIERPEPVYEALAQHVVRRVSKMFQRGGGEANSGEPPYVRTQDLAKSLVYAVNATGLDVGTNKTYSAQVHFGGVVRMKDKLLTVPVNAKARGKRAREFDLHFIPKSPASTNEYLRGCLVKFVGKDKKIEPYFALMTQVTTLPHPYLYWAEADGLYALRLLAKRMKLIGA